MGAPPAAVAALRVAVRRCMERHLDTTRRHMVLVACSGGADSLALAFAAGFTAPRAGMRCGLVTVDHGLQEGSAQRAEQLAAWARTAGFDPVLAVAVDASAHPGGQGPEAAARTARYAALTGAALRFGASAVLLGHTLDDQAETVLLAMARGSGPRGLSGMPERRSIDGVTFLRPMLAISRATARAACTACAAGGIEPWDDPHNADPAFARARVRAAMPVLTETLGHGVVANLARTAAMVAADLEFLDAATVAAAGTVTAPDGGLYIAGLAGLPEALRLRVLHRWCVELGVTRAALSSRHVEALDALVIRWKGQGTVSLPHGVRVVRRDGRLVVGGRPATAIS